MASFRQGTIVELLEERMDVVRVGVKLPEGVVEAAGFPSMLGRVEAGDRVVVNTTGIDLGLGTGGVAFILWNLDGSAPESPGPGHVVKLRYTPWQTEVPAVEAPESPHHDLLQEADSIEGTSVVACGLHSQVAAVAAGVKAARPEARVGYLMTDGGALPVAWSKLIHTLKATGLLDVTCTGGHAFGGDLEAVNVFSGLTALSLVASADVIIAAMGPGVVGTGTKLGHTAIEQGQVLDAAGALGGRAVACLRISFAPSRERHQGVSHHTLTALSLAARDPCDVAIPKLPVERAREIRDQLVTAGVAERHELVEVDGGPGVQLLRRARVEVTSMGRSLDDVPELFLAGAAAGALAAAGEA